MQTQVLPDLLTAVNPSHLDSTKFQLGVAQNVMIDEVVKLIHTKIEKLWTKEQYCPPGPALVDGDVNVDRLTRLLVIPTDHSDLYIKARLAKLIETLNLAC